MSTVSTKYVPLEKREKNLTGDRVAEMPKRASGAIIQKSSIVLESEPEAKAVASRKEAMLSTHQRDFAKWDKPYESPSNMSKQHTEYMTSKHFELGYDERDNNSTNRLDYARFDNSVLIQNKSEIMGMGKSSKNQSNLFRSEKDVAEWTSEVNSTHRLVFQDPSRTKQTIDNLASLKKDQRSSHFNFGEDLNDFNTTTHRMAYNDKGYVREHNQNIAAKVTSASLGQPDENWAQENLKTTKETTYTGHMEHVRQMAATRTAPLRRKFEEDMSHVPPQNEILTSSVSLGTDKTEYITHYQSEMRALKYSK